MNFISSHCVDIYIYVQYIIEFIELSGLKLEAQTRSNYQTCSKLKPKPN